MELYYQVYDMIVTSNVTIILKRIELPPEPLFTRVY